MQHLHVIITTWPFSFVSQMPTAMRRFKSTCKRSSLSGSSSFVFKAVYLPLKDPFFAPRECVAPKNCTGFMPWKAGEGLTGHLCGFCFKISTITLCRFQSPARYERLQFPNDTNPNLDASITNNNSTIHFCGVVNTIFPQPRRDAQ